jgi:LysR family transcriptional regulator of gallate degradation
MGSQQEVDSVADLGDRPVAVFSFAQDSDVRLIYMPTPDDRRLAVPERFLQYPATAGVSSNEPPNGPPESLAPESLKMSEDKQSHASTIGLHLAYLRAFLCVANRGGATQAARALYRSQSGMTRAIEQLEYQLGEVLFERKCTGMKLTAIGRCVLLRAERVMGELRTIAWASPVNRRYAGSREDENIPAYLLNTRRLEVFAALARARHMPTAARAVGVTQPAVSSALKILEVGAGCRLFERNNSGLLPSEIGGLFTQHIIRALHELRCIRADIDALNGRLRGNVVVGALPLARSSILPDAAVCALKECPGIRISTDESPYESLLAALRLGDIDLIVGALRPDVDAREFIQQELISEGMVLVTRPGHPLANRDKVTLNDLNGVAWILPRDGTPARVLINGVFEQKNMATPAPTVETADLAVIRGVLRCSDMVAAVSAQQLRVEIQSGELIVLNIDMPGTSRSIGLMWRNGSAPSPAALLLISALRAVAMPGNPR